MIDMLKFLPVEVISITIRVLVSKKCKKERRRKEERRKRINAPTYIFGMPEGNEKGSHYEVTSVHQGVLVMAILGLKSKETRKNLKNFFGCLFNWLFDGNTKGILGLERKLMDTKKKK